jgi:hypothetical protein
MTTTMTTMLALQKATQLVVAERWAVRLSQHRLSVLAISSAPLRLLLVKWWIDHRLCLCSHVPSSPRLSA